MLKMVLSAAVLAAGFAGAVPPAAAGPQCPAQTIEPARPAGSGIAPRAEFRLPQHRAEPIEVHEAGGGVRYIDRKSFTPVLPGLPGCLG